MISRLVALAWTLVVPSAPVVQVSEVVATSRRTCAGHSARAFSVIAGNLGRSLIGALSLRIAAWSISLVGSSGA
eukprot:9493287-Pyramimonas_sp.AAC.1